MTIDLPIFTLSDMKTRYEIIHSVFERIDKLLHSNPNDANLEQLDSLIRLALLDWLDQNSTIQFSFLHKLFQAYLKDRSPSLLSLQLKAWRTIKEAIRILDHNFGSDLLKKCSYIRKIILLFYSLCEKNPNISLEIKKELQRAMLSNIYFQRHEKVWH